MTNKEAIKAVDWLIEEEAREEVVDALHMAKEALELQNPKEPTVRWTGDETVIECPNCGKYPFDLSEYKWARQFCGNCGQAIDWSDEEC